MYCLQFFSFNVIVMVKDFLIKEITMSKIKTNLLQLLSFLPALLLLYMIFGFSSQDAETSGSLSFEISLFIVRLFSPLLPVTTNEDIFMQRAEMIHIFVRKAAHMTEYFLLALSLQLPLYSYLRQKIYLKKRIIIGFLFTVLIAIADEFYQTTIPGRSGNIIDVCIDSTGALIAMFFLISLSYIKNHKINNNNSTI